MIDLMAALVFETTKLRDSSDTCVLCAGGMRFNKVWITPANAMLKYGAKNKMKTMAIEGLRAVKAIADSMIVLKRDVM